MTEKIVTTDWVRERYADRDLGYPNLDDLDDFDAWLAEVIRAAREEGFQMAWWSSGEGFNGEYPDEGVPWERSAGKEAYDRWMERSSNE